MVYRINSRNMNPYSLPDFIKLVSQSAKVDYSDSQKRILDVYKPLFNLLDQQFSIFYFIHDFSNFKYILVSKSFEKMVGIDNGTLVDESFGDALLKYIHPEDGANLRLIHEKLFAFFYESPVEDRLKMRFDFNFRMRKASGQFIHILQQSVFIALSDEGAPLYDFTTCTDISHYKKDDLMELSIHKLNDQGFYDQIYAYNMVTRPCFNISSREVEIMKYIVEGLSCKQIADKCKLSINTVQNHRKNILKKTSSGTISEAIAKARI